ncbi:hypothetical protein [Gaetbulibacter aestuarii]|uniref:Cytochrome c domain-containing protein n=1 Tax=Gaetbulibacter aestuarii TaxID=1502358 RepID=A0ABW7MXF6_9FLAO
MKNLQIILLAFIIVLFYNCSGDSAPAEDTNTNNPSNPSPNPDPAPTTKVTYTADIAGIMSGNCTSCHSDPPTQGAPQSLTSYTQVKNYVDLIIARVNSSTNPMPPTGQMPEDTRSLIQKWKDDGLLEN